MNSLEDFVLVDRFAIASTIVFNDDLVKLAALRLDCSDHGGVPAAVVEDGHAVSFQRSRREAGDLRGEELVETHA